MSRVLFLDNSYSNCVWHIPWSELKRVWPCKNLLNQTGPLPETRLWSLQIWHRWSIKATFVDYDIKFVHDDVIKWKHFLRYCPFVRGIHWSPVNSPHKGQWRGALMLTLTCARINGWVNNREAGGLRRYRTHYDVIVMILLSAVFQYGCQTWFGRHKAYQK